MTIETVSRYAEEAVIQSKELLDFLNKRKQLAADYAANLEKLCTDFQIAQTTRLANPTMAGGKSRQTGINNFLEGFKRSNSGPSIGKTAKGATAVETLHISLWLAMMSIVEDGVRDADLQKTFVATLDKQIIKRFKMWSDMMEQHYKECNEMAKRVDKAMEEKAGDEPALSFHRTILQKLYSKYTVVEEFRVRALVKVLLDYGNAKIAQLSELESASGDLLQRLDGVDVHEHMEDFRQAHTEVDPATLSSGYEWFLKSSDLAVRKSSGKWSVQTFSLQADKRQLVFFTKKSLKILGIINLSNFVVHDIDDSVTSRNFCFLLARANNSLSSNTLSPSKEDEEFIYLSADSQRQKSEWLVCLGLLSYCCSTCEANPQTVDVLTQSNQKFSVSNFTSYPRFGTEITDRAYVVRTVNVEVAQAFGLESDIANSVNKSIPDAYCVLSLATGTEPPVPVARTSTKLSAAAPIWDESFALSDVQHKHDTLIVTVHSRRKSSWFKGDAVLGKVSVPLTMPIRKWHFLRSVDGEELAKPSVLFGFSVQDTTVLPISEYSNFWRIVTSPSDAVYIFRALYPSSGGPLQLIEMVLEASGGVLLVVKWLSALVEAEIMETTDSKQLFRLRTFTTDMIERFLRQRALEWITRALAPCLQAVCKEPLSCEIDPNRIAANENPHENAARLVHYINEIWKAIVDSEPSCPTEIRTLMRNIYVAVTEMQYEDTNAAFQSVGSFIFLRLIVPIILNPAQAGIDLDENASPFAPRTLKLLAKAFQKLSNQAMNMEAFMKSVLDEMTLRQEPVVRGFLIKLTETNDTKPIKEQNFFKPNLRRSLAHLHSVMSERLEDIITHQADLQSPTLEIFEGFVASIRQVAEAIISAKVS